MHYQQGSLIFSPSDLTQFMSSPFASWMDRFSIEKTTDCPERDQPDPLMQVLQQKGYTHEDAIIESFKQQNKTVLIIDSENTEHKLTNTINAIKDGVDVIVQARLEKESFAGFADFLVKVDDISSPAAFSYEVWDAKLSSKVKPEYLIQLCCYADMLQSVTGSIADNICVVLGNGVKSRFRTSDYFDYYLSLKARFVKQQHAFSLEDSLMPEDSSSYGSWSGYAQNLLIEKDHLFQVATITRNQIKKLNAVDIYTMTKLAHCALSHVPGIQPSVLQKLIAQANIQLRSKGKETPLFEILKPETGEKSGLALLPPNSPFDVFFDIEGYPLDEGGLEYLWGNTYFDEHGNRCFKDFWAHDSEQEKQCFEDFITWVYARWQQDSTMHIYHYANYEIAACRKLMGRYGICEFEVDQLLRNEVFVDLYKVVKSGILLGEPKYSIKNVEHLYRGKRQTEVGTGGDSVVVYEHWRTLNQQGVEGDTWQTSKTLNDIRDYNIDDCDSTQELVDWLRHQQQAHGIAYLGKTDVEEPELSEEVSERTQLRDRLLQRADMIKETQPVNAALTENLAWLLEFHRREAKPVYWRLFDRLAADPQQLLDDLDCLALCQRTDRAPFTPKRARTLAYEYQFEPTQDFKGNQNSFYVLGEETEDGKSLAATMVPEESALEDGLIALKCSRELPDNVTLVPNEIVRADVIERAIHAFVAEFENGELTLDNNAAIAFLTRSTPSIEHIPTGEPIAKSHNSQERLFEIIEAVKGLQQSYLPIQGPPGSGKSYTGKHIIAELMKSGKTVGISSNSHKAINNLLISTAKHCNSEAIEASFACTKDTDVELTELGITVTTNSKLSEYLVPGSVIGTTAWGFAREELKETFDYLFIDEAGQVSIANLVAMSRCAKNIVLMGDQMQLGQPSKGAHPLDSGLSILDYLLHDKPTIEANMGVFLETTYRMHSSVNQFISKHIYESKLNSHLSTDKRFIDVPEHYDGLIDKSAGIFFSPVEHEGNTQASEEEISEIIKLSNELLGRTYHTGEPGTVKKITLDDILYVAPYNYQVTRLKQALGPNAKVGTVDKFQGQEAPIVFVSMCTSDASESPRGIDFVFDKHRINVAISRAKCMAIVVGNPNLANTRVSKPEHMALVNLFASLTSN